MIQNDASIPDNYLEAWTREIARWVDVYADNMFARNALSVRKVDESVQIDVVVEYTKTGSGAQVIAKGGVPTTKTGISSSTSKQDIYQLMDSFNVHEKDLKSSPSIFNKSVDICLRNIHQLEDNLAINGDTNLNLKGIVNAAVANTNGKVVASGASGSDVNNAGAWDGSETGGVMDPHADLVNAIEMLDGNYDPAYLAGNKKDLAYLFKLDSERQPYWKTIAGLFGYSEQDRPYKTWLKPSKKFARGKIYVMSKDVDAAEMVISENPYPDRLPKQAGGNFPVELKSWSVPRVYDNEGFVEIAIT